MALTPEQIADRQAISDAVDALEIAYDNALTAARRLNNEHYDETWCGTQATSYFDSGLAPMLPAFAALRHAITIGQTA